MLPVADCNLQALYYAATEQTKCILRSSIGCLSGAVNYLHSNKIRHRDIKPANILVRGKDVYLADFGISLDWEDLSRGTTTADSGRTFAYSAPEVINGQKRNESSDVWSLGCVFLEISTVLKGRNVDFLRARFKEHSDSMAFHRNIPMIRTWMAELRACGSVLDSFPLDWIQLMLQTDTKLRPTAQGLYQWSIGTFTRSASVRKLFCGDCCIADEETDSDSSGYMSDGELWVDNENKRILSTGLTDLILEARTDKKTQSDETLVFHEACSLKLSSEQSRLSINASPHVQSSDRATERNVDFGIKPEHKYYLPRSDAASKSEASPSHQVAKSQDTNHGIDLSFASAFVVSSEQRRNPNGLSTANAVTLQTSMSRS